MLTICLAALAMGSGAGMQTDPFGDAKWLTVFPLKTSIREAKWIWVQKPGEDPPTSQSAKLGKVSFVKEIELDGPRFAWFTADNRCTVKVNGREFKSEDWSKLEMAHGFVKGRNRIEVTAENDPGAEGQTNPAGFIFVLEGSYFTRPSSPIVSDASWTSPDGQVVEVAGYSEGPWRLPAATVPAPEFRRLFQIEKPVKKAIAKVIGLGHYDIFANYNRKGDGYLNQPWSQYDKTLYWQEFDLTKDLYVGRNSLHIQLANSWYRVEAPPPGRYAKGDAMPDFSKQAPYLLRAVIEIEYQDGGRETITTDDAWRWRDSKYTLSHVFAGEDYDARQDNQLWMDVRAWRNPVIAQPPKAQLLKMDWPAIKAKQVWKPIDVKNPNPGEWSYVFPQNAMAILRFRVKGKRGQTVKFRPSEVMNEKGEVVQLNLWGGEASCSYTLWGGKSEQHEWRFWYHGFQFVQMTGAVPKGKPNPDGLPVIEDLEMVHIRTDNPEVGKFETSSELYNRIHNLVDWAMKSNMSYVFTDCPQREKLGWQEQVYLLDRTFMYRYDVRQWFHKIARDLRDAQVPDGRFPTVAPDYLVRPIDDQYKFTVEWGASGVLMPWDAYEWYGDKRFLEENYEAMRRYVQFLIRDEREGLARKGLGDWYDYGHGQGPGPSRYTPTDLTSTCIYAMCVRALADAAEALGHADKEVLLYRGQFAFIKQAFLKKFYDPATKTLKNTGSVQSGHAMALCADLIPTEDRAAVLQHIVDELEKRDYQQTAGDVGHVYFIRALAEAGRSDVLHKVYSRTGVGSYGGILAKGLTTMPETWDAITVGSNSLNHAMLGHVMEWFYGWVLGIRQAPGSVGWKHIWIAPEFGNLQWAKGETRTPQGVVKVSWKVAPYVGGKTGGSPRALGPITLEVDIPKGSRASIPTYGRRATVDGRRFEPSTAQPMIEFGPGKHKVVLEPRAEESPGVLSQGQNGDVFGVRLANGWSEILLQPELDQLSGAKAEAMTKAGLFRVEWQASSKSITLSTVLPPGSKALVPTMSMKGIAYGREFGFADRDTKFVADLPGRHVFEFFKPLFPAGTSSDGRNLENQAILGIRRARGSADWKRIVIDPDFDDFQWARGELRTPQGTVTTSWQRSMPPDSSPRVGRIVLDVSIPPNTRASIQTYGRMAKVNNVWVLPWRKSMIDLGPGKHKVVLE